MSSESPPLAGGVGEGANLLRCSPIKASWIRELTPFWREPNLRSNPSPNPSREGRGLILLADS